MDPVTVKFVQLIVLEVAGIAIAGFGAWITIRAASGKGIVIVEGLGLKARLVNTSPGVMVMIVGSLLTYWSLSGHVTQETTNSPELSFENEVLQEWLTRSKLVPVGSSYKDCLDIVVRNESLLVVNHTLKSDTDFGAAARLYYGSESLLPLLGAANSDREEYRGRKIDARTKIRAGSVIEVWRPSKRAIAEQKTIVKVSSDESKANFFDLVLTLTTAEKPYDAEVFDRLDAYCKAQEIGGLGHRTSRPGGDWLTLNELSLAIYGSKKYAPILSWINAARLPDDLPLDREIPHDIEIEMILLFNR